MSQLVYGLLTGIAFGFLLQKAQVLRYDKQVGALRLIDMTILKFMLSAIVVASIGIYLFKDLGLIKLSIKATSIGAQVVGGLLFGIGWGLLGYCPGTAAGADHPDARCQRRLHADAGRRLSPARRHG